MKRNKSLINILFILFLLTAYYQLANATIRYVSKTGLSIPPYITWETAADSIQKCINISVFGDTIYVANGVYEEQVVMIPGLVLIGAGLDSCWIDSRQLVTSWDDVAVEIADSCLLKGFKIIVSNNPGNGIGLGIAGSGSSKSLVTLNRITSASNGIFLDATFYIVSDICIYKNICDNVGIGINMFNSNSVVRNNFIYPGDFSGSDEYGILLGAFNNNYSPIIDSNHIESKNDGIRKSFGTKPTITNNTIRLKSFGGNGIYLGGNSDSVKVFNNLIIAEEGYNGIYKSGIQYLQLYNNYVTGNFYDEEYAWAIYVARYNESKHNVVTNALRGIGVYGNGSLVVKYNNLWNNEINNSGFILDTTNLSVDPMIVNEDSTRGELDFHLQKYSPLIDAGDPTMIDKDSSRIDIGLYGGLRGEIYEYIDYQPKPPRNLTAEVDSNVVTLRWNKNTEEDTAYYNVYRDTVANFAIDSTKLISSQTDTFFIQTISQNVESLYYKATAVDNQGNESNPSEEVSVILVSVKNEWKPVNNYILYQNYPNPFNPSTKIGYRLKERGYVKLYVYDIKGELVSVLVNQTREAGYYEVEFNASVGSRQSAVGNGHSGLSGINGLASGVYIYQIMVKNEKDLPVFSDIKKMVYIK